MILLDELLQNIKSRIEKGEILSPMEYLDIAEKLNVLRSDDDDLLWETGQVIAKDKQSFIETGFSVAKATAIIQAGENYKKFQKIKAKLNRIDEIIRLAKLRSRLADQEFKGY